MALGGNPNKSSKTKTKLGGTGGTEYKGLQGNAGATYGQAPYGGNNVTNEIGYGQNEVGVGVAGLSYEDEQGFTDPTLGGIAELIQLMTQMYQSYTPMNLSSNATAKAQLREAQLAGRKPPNEGAFYVGY